VHARVENKGIYEKKRWRTCSNV